MLHELLVVFRHTVTGADLGRKECGAGAGWEGVRVRSLWVRGGSGQKH